MIDFLKNQNFHRNLTVDELVNHAVSNNEGVIGLNGALMVDTGAVSYTCLTLPTILLV